MSSYISGGIPADPLNLLSPSLPLQDAIQCHSAWLDVQPETPHRKDGILFARGVVVALGMELASLLLLYGLWKVAHLLL